ncbi:PREDICTED: uncharacterized protein LOC108755922 [Trachymyrmex septentrionalis]|uniref:uncharacterized protein LOC108755922 n=1 Tax=Trachymyrmex septentrionalis TaxID=34720 RepID=UPI00084EFFE7|nr:PREDICTED: uncharacterized protein LOC108755922 [Trachymyrmex septentrionalis]
MRGSPVPQDTLSEETSDGKSITKIEAALWWHRGSLSWRASDRNCIGGRPENRAAPSNTRSPASRIIYLKTHHAASSLWHCREAREDGERSIRKSRRTEADSTSCTTRELGVPRGSIVGKRPDRKLLTGGLISAPYCRLRD